LKFTYPFSFSSVFAQVVFLSIRPIVNSTLLFSQQNCFFTGLGCETNAQPPTWRTRVFLLVWNLILDLSGL
jgi:hypothetical protein